MSLVNTNRFKELVKILGWDLLPLDLSNLLVTWMWYSFKLPQAMGLIVGLVSRKLLLFSKIIANAIFIHKTKQNKKTIITIQHVLALNNPKELINHKNRINQNTASFSLISVNSHNLGKVMKWFFFVALSSVRNLE